MKIHPLVRLSAAVGTACVLSVTLLVMPFVRSGASAPRTLPQYLCSMRTRRPALRQEGEIVHADSAPAEVLPEATLNDGLDLPQAVEGQFTVLFLGFDSRENGSGGLHDVSYLMQFGLAPAGLTILQIPRDTYMPGYAEHSPCPTHKFNSIYTCGDPALSGIQRVVNACEESFGVPVDAYVTTDCDAVAQIVDLLGGVPADIPYRIAFEPGRVIEPGPQTLTGEQAEWLLRYRKGYAMGDIGRIEAQRIFMAALLEKLKTLPRLRLLAVGENVLTQGLASTDLDIRDLARLADLAETITPENTEIFLLPGESAELDGQSLWSVHKQAALDLINAKLRTRQRPLLPAESTLTELIPEGSYRSTAFDDAAEHLSDADAPIMIRP